MGLATQPTPDARPDGRVLDGGVDRGYSRSARGPLVPGREEALSRALNREVQLARPLSLHGRDAKGFDDNCDREAVFTTACGLCRWGDV